MRKYDMREEALSDPKLKTKGLGLVRYYQVLRNDYTGTNIYEGFGGILLILSLCRIWLSFSTNSMNHTSYLMMHPTFHDGKIIS